MGGPTAGPLRAGEGWLPARRTGAARKQTGALSPGWRARGSGPSAEGQRHGEVLRSKRKSTETVAILSQKTGKDELPEKCSGIRRNLGNA